MAAHVGHAPLLHLCRLIAKVHLVTHAPMPMAPVAARGPLGSLPRISFFSPSLNTTMAFRLGRRARTVILGGVVPRSGPRDDGEWGADDPDPSIGTGRLVDESMATLRWRILQARMALSEDAEDADASVRAPLPARWTELERRHHGSYVAGLRGTARLLEALLVNARPGVGVAVLALLLLGVPASAFLVCAKLIQAVGAISSVVNGR